MNGPPTISLVVIGCNSENTLRSIYHGRYLEVLREMCGELIYVDSASRDDSAAFMAAAGFAVRRLCPDGVMNAAAGRAVGTAASQSHLILYLDSDMELEHPEKVGELAAQVLESPFCGVVGEVVDVLPDGTRRLRVRKVGPRHEATSFGGFLIIEREAVLQAGNWNSGLCANEELELHCRLTRKGQRVLYRREFRVFHHTGFHSSPLNQLAALYIPWVAPRRYGAFGKVIHSSLRGGFLGAVIRHFPEPFLLLLALLAFFGLRTPWPGVALLLFYEGVLLRRRSWKFNAVVPGVLLSAPYGFLAYRQKQARELSE